MEAEWELEELVVTSSDSPWFDRNPNTGGLFAGEIEGHVAISTIYHDAGRASHVVLPISKASRV